MLRRHASVSTSRRCNDSRSRPSSASGINFGAIRPTAARPIHAAASSYVCRVRDNTAPAAVVRDNPLGDRDRAAGVLGDGGLVHDRHGAGLAGALQPGVQVGGVGGRRGGDAAAAASLDEVHIGDLGGGQGGAGGHQGGGGGERESGDTHGVFPSNNDGLNLPVRL